jgi:hypothetical protein
MKQKLVWCKDMLIEIEPCRKTKKLITRISMTKMPSWWMYTCFLILYYLISKITHQTSAHARNFQVFHIISNFIPYPNCQEYAHHLFAGNQAIPEQAQVS